MGVEFNKIPQSAFIKATAKQISAEMIQKVCVRVCVCVCVLFPWGREDLEDWMNAYNTYI